MKHTKRKKKRPSSRNAKPVGTDAARDKQEEGNGQQGRKELGKLVEAFGSVSVGEVVNRGKAVEGHVNAAAEIWGNFLDSSDDPSTSSVSGSSTSGFDSAFWSGSGSGSWTGSSEGFMESGCLLDVVSNGKGGRKQKRVAATGTVSTVLGKDYVGASPRRRWKEVGNDNASQGKEEAAQFLYSMLDNDCQLSMAVVRDVLCQCGYNVEKALDVLLDLSAPACERSSGSKSTNDTLNLNYKENTRSFIKRSDNLTARTSGCTSHSSESEFQDGFRNYWKVLTSTEAPPPSSLRSDVSDLPQSILESLFNISKSKSAEHAPSTMNWRNVVKKVQSLGPEMFVCPSSVAVSQQETYAKGDEYQVLRKDAKQHWDSMRSCYQKAATAYSDGQRGYAAYLSDQGKLQTKLARKADERASQDIFEARNKGIENVITIDLHGQHVKQAMKLLKLHLVFGAYVPSVKALRVITGCGSHGLGKSKVKQSVVKLLENEGMKWSEENQGTVLVTVGGYREFSFLDSESDSE
ncbi:hypothetical protein HS088_TW02G00390 [Tripterygium wilfordii]|uniref:Smr domain-containing protein n=1 Tax=Tripterygium wilfordii TaxID=458696 RepID=A0A7J7DYH1_TRIWF|nr:SMR domain-containing protein At5g58720 isoform X1 [Tripterygium wilfordii]KAF5751377.1 hypothetical protein HS088_TW02G00390 [Tripterygium wilfordii]